MNSRPPTEAITVARKKPPQSAPPKQPDPPFERLEFQAPPGFTARLDRARRLRGLSRSAYIRQAVMLLMNEDLEDE